MKKKLLFGVLALSMFSISMSAQNKVLQKAEDGFEWYLVSQNGKYGATDANGKVLIPIEYDTLAYHPMDIHSNILAETKYCGFEVDEEVGRFFGEDCYSDKRFNICSTK